jgi:hypothetical protein
VVIQIDHKLRAARVTRYFELDQKVAEFKPTAEEYAALGAEIVGWHDLLAPEKSFAIDGVGCTADITERRQMRVIASMTKVKTFFGLPRFLKLCTFALKHLDAFVAEPERSALAPREEPNVATGPRRLTVTAKAAAA